MTPNEALQAQITALTRRLDELEYRVDAHTENINFLRGDPQRVQAAPHLVLAGPVGSAAPRARGAAIEGADAGPAYDDLEVPAANSPHGVGAFNAIAAAVPDNGNPNTPEYKAAAAEAVAAGFAQPTPTEERTPAMIAAEEALARNAERSTERRANRKAAGR